MDNIAEGFGRKGNLEFINFLTYSSGSACECKSQLYRAYDRDYVTEEKRKELSDLADETGKDDYFTNSLSWGNRIKRY